MRRIAPYGTAILLSHALVSLVHVFAHFTLGVEISFLQWAYVVGVWVVMPLLVLACLWTGRLRSGSLLLFLCMLGALVFGGVNHFVIISADHIFHAPTGASLRLFQATAVLMSMLEVLGCVIGLWGMVKVRPSSSD